MSWRNRQSTRESDSALNRVKLQGVLRALHKMRDKQIALAKQPFTLPELMDLFVEKQHHEHLRYVYDLIEPSGMTTVLHVSADVQPVHSQYGSPMRSSRMMFSWYGAKPGGFHVPHARGAEPNAPADLLDTQADPMTVEKYKQVEQDLLDIQCRFALCERVVHLLNLRNVCKTLPQIRYVWPAITILLAKGGFETDAAALAEPSARAGAGVVLGEWLTKHVKETNDTIVRAVMLDDVPTPNENDLPVSYYLADNFVTYE